MTIITNLTCEYRTNPLGIGVRLPRLSWKLASNRRGAKQTAYQIRAAASGDDLVAGRNLLWDTGQVASDQIDPHRLRRPGACAPASASAGRCAPGMRPAQPPRGARPAWWEMGLLDAADWQAEWITPDWDEDTTQSAAAADPAPRRSRSTAR